MTPWRWWNERQRHKLFKAVLGVEPQPVVTREVWFSHPAGYGIYAHLHLPRGATEPLPGVVIVPGGKSPGTDYDRGAFVRADDVAALGMAVLHYDPAGRGMSGGEENFWGTEHQAELAWVLKQFKGLSAVDGGDIGILSFSIGIVIASGCLARHSPPCVNYLIDWEGPSNRINTTRNDTHKPLRAFPSSNSQFWDEREAARFIGELAIPYFRFQSITDHVQGGFKGHAVELVNLATRGRAAWTRCNDLPPNTVLAAEDQPGWLPPELSNFAQMLKYLRQVHEVGLRLRGQGSA